MKNGGVEFKYLNKLMILVGKSWLCVHEEKERMNSNIRSGIASYVMFFFYPFFLLTRHPHMNLAKILYVISTL
jgi:hypothetical protein